MAVLKLQYEGSNLLRTPSEEITEFNDYELEKLVEDMKDTMKAHDGIGLAAPQVGALKRVIVLDFEPFVMFNPEILEIAEIQTLREGCLSFPKLFFNIPRAKKIMVSWQDSIGFYHAEQFEDLKSTTIQHEIEHLDGKLFIDHVKPMNVLLAKKKLQSKGPKC